MFRQVVVLNVTEQGCSMPTKCLWTIAKVKPNKMYQMNYFFFKILYLKVSNCLTSIHASKKSLNYTIPNKVQKSFSDVIINSLAVVYTCAVMQLRDHWGESLFNTQLMIFAWSRNNKTDLICKAYRRTNLCTWVEIYTNQLPQIDVEVLMKKGMVGCLIESLALSLR